MKVTLVDFMGDQKRVADIASICYGKEEAENPSALFAKLIEMGHHSVLEHVVFTFKIEEVSRALLAQLTRHRIASFTVESQRYTEYGLDGLCTLPESIRANEEAFTLYENNFNDILFAYKRMIELGIPKEDARMILPQSFHTKLYMTINLRSLMNLIKLRTSKGAQWEIKGMAEEMRSLVFDAIGVLL